MKLATTTGDFGAYTSSQNEAMKYINQAGFKYLDYNFGVDYNRRDGVYSDDFKGHIESIKKTAKAAVVDKSYLKKD